MPAGWETRHAGFGPCRAHGGTAVCCERAWEMAREIAREHDVTAEQALPWAVRMAAAAVLRCEEVLATYDVRVREGALNTSRKERALLAQTAKATVDAGILGRIARNLEQEGQLLGAVLIAALDGTPTLTPDQRVSLLSAAHTKLTEIEGDGTWADQPPEPPPDPRDRPHGDDLG
jgi:hypothetical protein